MNRTKKNENRIVFSFHPYLCHVVHQFISQFISVYIICTCETTEPLFICIIRYIYCISVLCVCERGLNRVQFFHIVEQSCAWKYDEVWIDIDFHYFIDKFSKTTTTKRTFSYRFSIRINFTSSGEKKRAFSIGHTFYKI